MSFVRTEPPPIPYSIRLFERMQISALVVGWVNAALTYRLVLHDKVNPIAYSAAMIAASAVVALLVFRITRRRSTTCKWILIVLSALATAPWIAALRRVGAADLPGLLSLFQGLCRSPPSSCWCGRARAPGSAAA